ncbi:HEPN domain-containing protein [Vibrio harveyi]|uniref:HEPN domain-containing protein n=1 Tax=Vibrio sp. SSH13-20 TaxID=3136668 RepID=UPI0032C420FA
MITKAMFLKYMDEIDQELLRGDLKLHQRPMHAFTCLTEKVDKSGTYKMNSGENIDREDFSNDALCAQVHWWYEERYGDRIKIHPGPGSYVIVIRGEPWEVVFPLCFGQNNFTIDADLARVKRKIDVGGGRMIPEINILSHVTSMTQYLASSLSYEEKSAILHDYMFGLNAVQSLKDSYYKPFMELAANDYDLSVFNIFQKYPDYNNSKWSSLQFSEKVMKSKLCQLGATIKRTHDLKSLAKTLSEYDVNISDSLIERVQCSPSVRYGETKVTKHEAIEAIKCSLAIYQQVFNASSYEF